MIYNNTKPFQKLVKLSINFHTSVKKFIEIKKKKMTYKFKLNIKKTKYTYLRKKQKKMMVL